MKPSTAAIIVLCLTVIGLSLSTAFLYLKNKELIQKNGELSEMLRLVSPSDELREQLNMATENLTTLKAEFRQLELELSQKNKELQLEHNSSTEYEAVIKRLRIENNKLKQKNTN